jgi:hypothetical protein
MVVVNDVAAALVVAAAGGDGGGVRVRAVDVDVDVTVEIVEGFVLTLFQLGPVFGVTCHMDGLVESPDRQSKINHNNQNLASKFRSILLDAFTESIITHTRFDTVTVPITAL